MRMMHRVPTYYSATSTVPREWQRDASAATMRPHQFCTQKRRCMRSDAEIWRDVTDELHWTPMVDEKDIAIKVNAGVVTLTGYVKSLEEVANAVRAAKRVAGVRAVADDLVVKVPDSSATSDPDVARNAAAALERELPELARNIRIIVHDGQVSLEGTVDWQRQRLRAEGC